MAKCGKFDLVDEDYLEKNNVGALISKALLQISIFQPEDPFQFLANHFEWEKSKSSPLKYASSILCCQPYPQSTIETGIRQAYLMLTQCKGSDDIKALTGAVYMDLIQMLCVELQQENPEEELRLLENIYISPRNVLSFREFRAGVHCCLFYKSYSKAVKSLFNSIPNESATSGSISRSVATSLIQHLNQQLDSDIGERINGSGNEAPPALRATIENDLITLHEFLTIATDLFWKKISVEAILQ